MSPTYSIGNFEGTVITQQPFIDLVKNQLSSMSSRHAYFKDKHFGSIPDTHTQPRLTLNTKVIARRGSLDKERVVTTPSPSLSCKYQRHTPQLTTIIDRIQKAGLDKPGNVRDFHRFLMHEKYGSQKSECAISRHFKCKKATVFPSFKRRTVSIEKDSNVGREIIEQRTVRTQLNKRKSLGISSPEKIIEQLNRGASRPYSFYKPSICSVL